MQYVYFARMAVLLRFLQAIDPVTDTGALRSIEMLNTSSSEEQPTIMAARLLLLGIRSAGAQDSGAVSTVLILPNGDRISDDQVPYALASMPKPLECSAELRRGELEVRCDGVGDQLAWVHRRSVERLDAGIGIVATILNSSPDLDAVNVLVKSTRDQMLVSARALAIWQREYVTNPPASITLHETTPEDANRGIRSVIAVSNIEVSVDGPQH